MSNHKRKKPKNTRAERSLCKPRKANGAKNKNKPSVKRVFQDPSEAELIAREEEEMLSEIYGYNGSEIFE